MSTGKTDEHRLGFGDFILDRRDERLLGRQGPIRLGHKAYRVLVRLVEEGGRLVTKDELFSSVWDGTIVSESALTSVIKELRRALGDDKAAPRYIESVYGRGYRLLAPVGEAIGDPAARPRMAEPPAVHPPLLYIPAFDQLALGEAEPHLAAVMREEILLALSRFRDIGLVSDTATSNAPVGGFFGERDYQLNVKLAGGGGPVRAFARLTRLASRAIIWADTVELPLDSPGVAADRLVRRIAAAALPKLQDDILGHLPTRPHDVHDRYFLTKLKMRGMHSFAEAREVAAAWEELVRDHPGFAPAYPPLTRLYNTDYCYWGLGATGEAERARAYELAHQAFAIDPAEAHLHTVKGWAHLWAGEWPLARAHLHQALELNPYNASRLVEVATALMHLDDLAGAADLLERCRRLAPFETEAPHEEQGLLHLLHGEFEPAGAELALVRRYHPDDRAGAKPTIRGELYALLAAAGADAPDLAARARQWRQSISERWCRSEPLDDARLKAWFSFHESFRNPERKATLLALLDRALAVGQEAPPRMRAPAPRQKAS
jgi:DNA-binding winged helix-turn-helix (wHTH) protein